MKYEAGQWVIFTGEPRNEEDDKKFSKALITYVDKVKCRLDYYRFDRKESIITAGDVVRAVESETCKLEDFPIEVGQVFKVDEGMSLAPVNTNFLVRAGEELLIPSEAKSLVFYDQNLVTEVSFGISDGLIVLKKDLLQKCTLIEPKEQLYVWKRNNVPLTKYMVLNKKNDVSDRYHNYYWTSMVKCCSIGTRQQWEQWCEEYELNPALLDERLVPVEEVNE